MACSTVVEARCPASCSPAGLLGVPGAATGRGCACAAYSPDLSQLVRRVDSPSSHASRPPAKKADFTRNRTRPTTKSHPFPLPKTHTKATGDDGGDFRCAEKKKGEIRPAGTISREGMRACILRQMVMDQMHWKEYTSHLLERQERQMVNHPETKRCPSLSCSLTAIGNPSNPHGLATRSSMQELEGERPQNLLSVVETALNRNRE